MTRMNAYTKVLNKQPKEHSKTQQEKKKKLLENPTKYIACKACGSSNVTLVRGTDSYYCKFCIEKQINKKVDKKKVK